VRVDVQAPSPTPGMKSSPCSMPSSPSPARRVAVQEYGKSNPDLIAGLEEPGGRGVARAGLSLGAARDTTPLRQAITAMAAARWTSRSLPRLSRSSTCSRSAAEEGHEAALRAAFGRPIVVGSVGPTTTETLRAINCRRHRAPAPEARPPRHCGRFGMASGDRGPARRSMMLVSVSDGLDPECARAHA